MTTKYFNVKQGITTGNITLDAGTGNVTGIGNISVLAGGAANLGNIVTANYVTATLTTASAAQPNITSLGTLTSVAISGNISSGNANLGNLVTANYFSGNGSLLTSLNASNISGTIANANYAAYAGNVVNAAQPNITSTGTLNSLTATGTVNFTGAGNVSLGPVANVHITGGTSGQFIQTDGSGGLTFASLPSGVAGTNTQVQFNDGGIFGADANFTYDKSTDTLNTKNITLESTGNLTGGNLVSATYLTGTLTTGAQPNITSTGTLTSLTVTGNISSGNANLGNLTTSNYFSGVLVTGAQPNITSTGTLTDLNVTGNVTGGNLKSNGSAYITSGLTVAGGGASITGNVGISGNLTVSGNLNYQNVTDLIVGDPLIYIGANNTANIVDLGIVGSFNDGTYQHTGIARDHTDGVWKLFTGVAAEPTTVIDWANASYADFKAGNIVGTGTLSITGNANVGNIGAAAGVFTGNVSAGNVSGGNLVSANYLTGTLTTAAQPNITSLGTLTTLVVGNATANVTMTVSGANGTLQSTGNITAPYFIGNVVGNISGNIVVPGVNTSILFNNSGNAGASSDFTYNDATKIVTLNGNIITNNANLGNAATANYFIGTFWGTANNATTAGTVTTAAQPNITSLGTLTGLTSGGTVNFTTASNVSLGPVGNVHISGGTSGQYLKTDGSGTLSWGTVDTSIVSNGTSNVNIPASNGNVNISVGGTANVAVFTTTGANITGVLTTSGNITASNADLGNLVTANYFSGNGYLLTGVAANTAATVTTNAQPNITSVGTLTTLTVTGNATVGNSVVNGAILSGRSTVSVSTNTVIDQFAPTNYSTAKYVIAAAGDYGVQSLEVLLVQDSINSYITIYGSISSNNSSDLVDVSSNISGVTGNVSLYATALGPNTTVHVSAIYLKS